MDARTLIKDAIDGAMAAKYDWDEAALMERGRVLRAFGPLFVLLDGAPPVVKKTFSSCMRDALRLPVTADASAVQEALSDLGFKRRQP